MASESVVLPNLKNALNVFFSNFHIALFIALVCGGAGFAVTHWMGDEVARATGFSGQSLLVVSTLTQAVLSCFWALGVGAWAAAAQIYLWVQREKNQPATLAGSINFGLNRLGRVAKAHFYAYSLVVLGNVVIVPGIIFGLQYAFVDAIATLDPLEQHPLSRSARLTSLKRGAIFKTMLVFALLWWVPDQLALVFLVPSMASWADVAFGTVDHLVLILVDLCMVQYYLDMFRRPVEPPADAAALPGSQSDNPWSASSPDSNAPTS